MKSFGSFLRTQWAMYISWDNHIGIYYFYEMWIFFTPCGKIRNSKRNRLLFGCEQNMTGSSKTLEHSFASQLLQEDLLWSSSNLTLFLLSFILRVSTTRLLHTQYKFIRWPIACVWKSFKWDFFRANLYSLACRWIQALPRALALLLWVNDFCCKPWDGKGTALLFLLWAFLLKLHH